MAVYLLQNIPAHLTNTSGSPAVSMFTYTTGTTTNKQSFTDHTGLTPHPNPVVADAGGAFPQVWLSSDTEYRIKVVCVDGTTLFTWDNVSGNGAVQTDVLAQLANATLNIKVATVQSGGGGGTDYTLASYVSRKNITLHADYGFLENSTASYTAGQPIVGHASFNDNITVGGTVASDHHHSFQSDFHYSASATIGVASSFWSQADITAGTVTELSGLKVNNPTGGGGTVTTHYGVYIASLTRATTSWGVYSLTKSFVGAPLWLGNAGGPQGLIEYSSNLGHIQVQPRAGFCFKIGAAAGDRKLRLGDPADDSFDATIENASDGMFKFVPRSGYGILLDGVTVSKNYTVANLPAAATWTYGRAMVSDATATTFNSVVAGGGANKVPVFSDGTNWRIG